MACKGVGFMGPRCCSGPECVIASDNFDRADSSTVDGWTRLSSVTWEIKDNKLKPPMGGFNDRILFDASVSGAPDGYRWSTTFDFGDPFNLTGEMRWIVDYLDSNNYHFGEVVVSGVNQFTIRVYRRESGFDTKLAELVINGANYGVPHTVSVCFGLLYVVPEPVFGISLTLDDTHGVVGQTTPFGGEYVGLSVDNAHDTFRYDNAVLSYLKPGCPACPSLAICGACANSAASRYLGIVIPNGAFAGTYLIPGVTPIGPFPAAPDDGFYAADCDLSRRFDNGCMWRQGFGIPPCVGSTNFEIYARIYADGPDVYLMVCLRHGSALAYQNRVFWRVHLREIGVDPPIDCLDDLDGIELEHQCTFGDDSCFTEDSIQVFVP